MERRGDVRLRSAQLIRHSRDLCRDAEILRADSDKIRVDAAELRLRIRSLDLTAIPGAGTLARRCSP